MNRCTRDCVQDRDCLAGETCTVNGYCASGSADGTAKPLDATDVPLLRDALALVDAALADVAPSDAAFDIVRDVEPESAPIDAPPPPPPPPDVGAAGPVGVYDIAGVNPGAMLAPSLVAWHPGGAYALIATATNRVFRYDATSRTVALAAMTSNEVAWRSMAFTHDGARALLAAATVSGTSRRGRLFVWDHATSMLSELTSEAWTSGTYESIRFAPDGRRAVLLGRSMAATTLWFVGPDGRRTGTPIARGMVSNTGCDDLAWVVDGYGAPALDLVCGLNTGEIARVTSLDASPRFETLLSSGAVGNTSRIAARRAGDLALAVGASSSRLYRMRMGRWDAGFASPTLRGAFGVAFNDVGTRAIAFGGFGYLHEYRADLYSAGEIVQTQIGLADAPFLQPTEARLADLAWRPGCDEGLAVGGANTLARQSVFVAYFRVLKGRRCP